MKRVLKMSDLCSSHQSDDIKEFIETMIEEYDLKEYCPMVILKDNAPNVIKAVTNSENIPVGCPCHRIENSISRFFQNAESFHF